MELILLRLGRFGRGRSERSGKRIQESLVLRREWGNGLWRRLLGMI